MARQTFKGSDRLPPSLPVKLILQCPLPSYLLPVALSPLWLSLPSLKLVHSSFREPSAIVTKPTSCLTSQASFNKVEMERKLPPLHSVLSGLIPWRTDVFILFSGTVWWIMALLARRDAKIRGYVPVMLMLLYPIPDSQGPFTDSQYLLDSLIKEIDEDVYNAFPMPGTLLPQTVTEWSLSHHSSLSWNVTCFPEHPLSSSTSVIVVATSPDFNPLWNTLALWYFSCYLMMSIVHQLSWNASLVGVKSLSPWCHRILPCPAQCLPPERYSVNVWRIGE